MNPQNINDTEETIDPTWPTFKLLRYKYVKSPAKSGAPKTWILHASMKGRIKYNKLKGEKTADW